MNYKDYYKILGVKEDISQKDLKKAYKKLAVQYHPDKNQGDKAAENKFKEINEAYEVLKDPKKRKKYDQLGANWEAFQQNGGEGYDWAHSGGSPFGNGGSQSYQFQGDPREFFNQGRGNSGFSDFFEAFFGGEFQSGFESPFQGGSRSIRGQDIQAELSISLEEAYHGSAKAFELNGEKLRIKIKPGAYDGQKLVLRGKGMAVQEGGKRGDLYLILRQMPHAEFRREGNDLLIDRKIDLYQAVLGGKESVPTLSGPVNITIKPGTNSGQTLRLRGKGMPKSKQPNQYGDLLVRVQVNIPKTLSEEEKEGFEALRALKNPKVNQ